MHGLHLGLVRGAHRSASPVEDNATIFFNTFIGIMLGFYMSTTLARWWEVRTRCASHTPDAPTCVSVRVCVGGWAAMAGGRALLGAHSSRIRQSGASHSHFDY